MSFSIASSRISVVHAASTSAVSRARNTAVSCRAGKGALSGGTVDLGRRELGAGLVGLLALTSPARADEDAEEFKMDYNNYNSGSSVPEAESDLVLSLIHI